jgi:hypothetical protein
MALSFVALRDSASSQPNAVAASALTLGRLAQSQIPAQIVISCVETVLHFSEWKLSPIRPEHGILREFLS